MDRAKEVQHLNEADTHVANAERAVSKQLSIISELERDGHDTKEAHRQLRDFQKVLKTLQEHREIIVRTIEQIDKGLT